MEKKSILKELTIIFWLFVIGSIVGYIYEMIVVLVQKGYFESRKGLIYGPFTPVYGIGAIIYYLTLNAINKTYQNKKTNSKELCNRKYAKILYYVKIFAITALLGGITEYISSFVQEKVFGTISWDYSHLWFNLNGRTSLLHCTYWGLAGIMYVVCIVPLLNKLRKILEENKLNAVTTVLAVFMIANVAVSWAAGERQRERKENVSANSRFDRFLDEHYPDEYMDKIFANKKEVNIKPVKLYP